VGRERSSFDGKKDNARYLIKKKVKGVEKENKVP